MKYSQPAFYKFNQDSILLSEFASNFFRKHNNLRVVDLFAGSGIVGIEFSLKKKIDSIDFVEKEESFLEHLKVNIETFNVIKASIYICDVKKILHHDKYDLVLMNPPYYIWERSRKSSDNKRSKCKFIKENEIDLVSQRVKGLLKDRGYIAVTLPKELNEWSTFVDHFHVIKMKEYNNIKLLILQNKKSL